MAAANIEEACQEIALDGVRYVILWHGGRHWRLASLDAAWREEIASLGSVPDTASLERLASCGIWLAPVAAPAPIAVMCSGLGSDWPGMGRELYDNFPAAREAMDEIAALADWDILALLDEQEPEKISGIQFQILYLFLLEYAQWRQLASLGFKPDIFCGHSIGELVALCLAGVYSLESAWHLFETRAKHMEALEAASGAKTGMLGIAAGDAVIQNAMISWPELSISNINTPNQYVLSGPRADLLALRKHLRQNHIPAFMLNMGMAFHNPAMAVLRDLSYRRLNAMSMSAPRIPVLSCITGKLYPSTQAEICRHITDLDENTVNWVQVIQELTSPLSDYHVQEFVELGPRDTVCGLTREIMPDCLCWPAGTKGRETLAMRQLCARLFCSGHLSWEHICLQKNLRASYAWQPPQKLKAEPALTEKTPLPPEADLILGLLAEVSGKKLEDLRLDQDLRYDLALRSSNFPYLVQEAEARLKRPIPLENMFQIATVGDLVRFFCATEIPEPSKKANTGSNPAQFVPHKPLARFVPLADDWQPALIYQADAGFLPKKDDLIILCVFDAELLPQIWNGVAYIPCTLAVPSPLLKDCGELIGNKLLPLDCGLNPTADELERALQEFTRKHGKACGVFIAPYPGKQAQCNMGAPQFIEVCARFASSWLLVLQRFMQAAAEGAALASAREYLCLCSQIFPDTLKGTIIAWLDNDDSISEAANLLALEMAAEGPKMILWRQAAENSQLFCPASPMFGTVFPDLSPALPQGVSFFQGCCQFSRFAEPPLATHGKDGPIPLECDFTGYPWLPVSNLVFAIMLTGQICAPWLKITGLADIHFLRTAAMPAGVTRECKAGAHGKHSLPQDGALTKYCHVDLSLRELTPNKRHKGTYLPLADGSCLLGGEDIATPALWKPQNFCKDAKQIPTERIDKFYHILDFGKEWQLFKEFNYIQNQGACFPLPFAFDKSSIAMQKNWGYKKVSEILEGIFQGALFTLLLDGEANGEKADSEVIAWTKWHLRSLGFLKFDSCQLEDALCYIQLRKSWQDVLQSRFDCQAITGDGKIILTINHLEFARYSSAEIVEKRKMKI